MTSGEKHREIAEKIVNYALSYVEMAGRFEGRGKDRRITISDIVTLDAEGRPTDAPIRHGVDVMTDEIALALARVEAETIENYARTVDDPKRAHLHYDGCPFKPYQDDADSGDHPECTCAEAHNGAYWKGQFVLERGYKQLAVREAYERAARLCEDHGHSNGRIRASHKHLALSIRALTSERSEAPRDRTDG